MTDLYEIRDLVDKQNRALEDFQTRVVSKVDRLDKEMYEYMRKANRPKAPYAGDASNEKREHSAAFETWARTGNGGDVLAGIQHKTMQIGDDPSGGYLVPTQIDNIVDSLLRDISPIGSFRELRTWLCHRGSDRHPPVTSPVHQQAAHDVLRHQARGWCGGELRGTEAAEVRHELR